MKGKRDATKSIGNTSSSRDRHHATSQSLLEDGSKYLPRLYINPAPQTETRRRTACTRESILPALLASRLGSSKCLIWRKPSCPLHSIFLKTQGVSFVGVHLLLQPADVFRSASAEQAPDLPYPVDSLLFVLPSRQRGGLNALAEAVRSGSRALELLSEALVLDYLDLKFSRTLPRWDDQNPFRHNINQAFYSYTHRAHRPPHGTPRERGGTFQQLLL